MNNNSVKSVTAKSQQNKTSRERQSRKDSYKKKFNKPHMIIPQEDAEFIGTQKPSVMQLWLKCWRCDPYGSRWQVLNHNLSYSAFKKAKKILSEGGLFIFKSDRSIRDNRETVCWLVMNLHGSRRNDYWLDNEPKKEDLNEASQDKNEASQATNKPSQDLYKASISDQTHTEQAIQNLSGGSQEHLRNSSKEFLEVLPGSESEAGDRDRDPAFEGRVASAPPRKKKVEEIKQHPGHPCQPSQNSEQTDQPVEKQDPQALNKKSMQEVFDEEYKFDWRSTEASKRAIAQNLAIDEQKTTEEYQSAFSDASARIRAIFEEKEQQKLNERRLRHEQNKPKWM